jgi:hypothetical protein
MSFDWREYLGLADALVQTRTTLASEEACCRAAVSRAYYAVYGVARTQARDQEDLHVPATGDAHQQLGVHYRTGPTPRHRAIGEHLRQLRRARNRADYADQLARPVAMAQWAVRQARQLHALAPPGSAGDEPTAAEPPRRRPDE